MSSAFKIDQEIGERFPSVVKRRLLLDVRDREGIFHLFAFHRPELVFHTAALKHLPLVEDNVIEGVRTNVFGTRNVADAAHRYTAAAFVQISTDKAVRPISVMGATKRVAEMYCQALDRTPAVRSAAADNDRYARKVAKPSTRFVIVRFGNVLGSSGSVIPLFEKQLRQGGPLTVTDPGATRFFMTIEEAVELVLNASVAATKPGAGTGLVHVLEMGKPVRILELAEHIIRFAGYRPNDDIKIELIGLRPAEKLHEELFSPFEQGIDSCGDAGCLSRNRRSPTCAYLTLLSSDWTKLAVPGMKPGRFVN